MNWTSDGQRKAIDKESCTNNAQISCVHLSTKPSRANSNLAQGTNCESVHDQLMFISPYFATLPYVYK